MDGGEEYYARHRPVFDNLLQQGFLHGGLLKGKRPKLYNHPAQTDLDSNPQTSAQGAYFVVCMLNIRMSGTVKNSYLMRKCSLFEIFVKIV